MRPDIQERSDMNIQGRINPERSRDPLTIMESHQERSDVNIRSHSNPKF